MITENKFQREKDIERAVLRWCKQVGIWAVKLQGPGNRSEPDRELRLRGGRVIYVELKRPGKVPTPLQTACHERLRGMGFAVAVCRSLQEVKDFVAKEQGAL